VYYPMRPTRSVGRKLLTFSNPILRIDTEEPDLTGPV
jgi:hypothetical protein